MSPQINSTPIVPEQPEIPLSKLGLKVLVSELIVQKRHLTSVKQQNVALLAGDRLGFAALQPQYHELLADLEIQNKIRVQLFGTRRIEQIMKDWPEPEKANGKRVAGELRTVVLEVRRINEQNQKLVTNQVKYYDFMLNILVNTHRKGCMYGPKGYQAVNRGNIFFNSAA